MSGGEELPPGLRALLGSRVAPPRFVLFLVVMAGAALAWRSVQAAGWSDSLVIGFDLAALVFAVSLVPLLKDRSVATIRRHAAANDANRGMVLLITAVVSVAILSAIRSELPAARAGDGFAVLKLVGTLALSWSFTNLVFMLHYAHMHYSGAQDSKSERGGFDFPGTPDPDYWDFLYFSFTAGMSFAASDVDVTRGAVRRIVVAHSLLSFVFNIGVLAFSINVLAGAV